MTPSEEIFWNRARRRVADLQPDMSAAVLRVFQILKDSLSTVVLLRLIETGQLDALISEAAMERAFIPLRQRLRQVTERSFRYAVADLPAGGKVAGEISVMFDNLSPRVIDAVRTLESRVLTSMAADTREVVRAFVENGLRDGVGPRVLARDLVNVVGLGPSQLQQVENYRKALVDGKSVSRFTLRDKRLKPTTQEQIDRAVEAYRKRRVAQNAETISRTATLDSYKSGQRLSWEDAIEKGIVDRGRLMRKWVGVNDDRERDEHIAMNGEVQPFDLPYSNGEMVPGESTYNCRCLDRVFVARA